MTPPGASPCTPATARPLPCALLGKKLTWFEDIDLALDEWKGEVRPFIAGQSKLTSLKAQAFVPSNRFAFGVRSALLTSGFFARFRAATARRTRMRAKLLSSIFGERRVT